jgi:hypothetical protein
MRRLCTKYLPDLFASESGKSKTLGNKSRSQEGRLNASSAAETAEDELKEVEEECNKATEWRNDCGNSCTLSGRIKLKRVWVKGAHSIVVWVFEINEAKVVSGDCDTDTLEVWWLVGLEEVTTKHREG